MKKVAVILSGCGVFDGAEVSESVLTLLYLAKQGASYQCFAPDINQHHVINHISGEEMPEQRNVLIESARIARGEITALTELQVEDFDALILPGGFGAAKNLCDFALKGKDASIDPSVLKVCKEFARQNKPAGYACIAPVIMSQVYGEGIKLTIGDDASTAQAIEDMGGVHINCSVEQVIVDQQHKVVSTPAYMLATSILEADASISKMVTEVLALA